MKEVLIDIAKTRIKVSLDVESDIPYIFVKRFFQNLIHKGSLPCEGSSYSLTLSMKEGLHNSISSLHKDIVIPFRDDTACLYYDPVKRTANLVIKELRGYVSLYTAIYLLAAVATVSEGGCIFHSAGLVNKGKGYLFIGPSGAGKTTITRFARKFWILGEEAMALFKENGRYVIYPTPFGARDLGMPLPVGSRVRKTFLCHIYVLHKDREDYIEKIENMEAYKALLYNIPFLTLFGKDEIKKAMSLVSSLIKDLPVSNLHFTKGDRFEDKVISCE